MNPAFSGVVILTRFHSITAQVDLHGERLSDLLNDDRQSALRLSSAGVARLADPSKIIAQHPSAILPKHQIVLAFEPQRASTPARQFYGYVKKSQQKVFFMTDGIEVRGVVHLAGDLETADIHQFIVMRREMFAPITQALITFCDDERFIIKQEAVMVNVQRIHYIAKGTD